MVSLLFAVGGGAAFVWTWYGVQHYGDELRERIQTVENQRQFKNQFDQLIAMVGETEADRTMLETFILDDENDTIGLLSRFDEIAAAHRISFSTRELRVVPGDPMFDDLILGFQIDGNEDAVMNMVRMFETLPYHGSITSLSIERTEDPETGMRLASASMDMSLTIRHHDQ